MGTCYGERFSALYTHCKYHRDIHMGLVRVSNKYMNAFVQYAFSLGTTMNIRMTRFAIFVEFAGFGSIGFKKVTRDL